MKAKKEKKTKDKKEKKAKKEKKVRKENVEKGGASKIKKDASQIADAKTEEVIAAQPKPGKEKNPKPTRHGTDWHAALASGEDFQYVPNESKAKPSYHGRDWEGALASGEDFDYVVPKQRPIGHSESHKGAAEVSEQGQAPVVIGTKAGLTQTFTIMNEAGEMVTEHRNGNITTVTPDGNVYHDE